jgi:hypothetical protein
MAMFLSILLTAGFAFWFYQTSEKLGAKSPQWAVAGAISYLVPAWSWMLLVSKPYITALRSTAAKTTFSASMIGHSWIVIGVIAALLVYKFALLKTNVKADQP